MDYERIKIKKSHMKGFCEYIQKLEAIKNSVNTTIMKYQDECNHELVLSYAIDKSGETLLKKSRCLVCGNYFELDGTFDMFTERDIDKKSVLDITNIISENIQNTMVIGQNQLFLRAEEKFNELLNSDEELSLDMIKYHIISDLILFERDLRAKKLARVKID